MSCDLLPAEPGMSQPVFVTIVGLWSPISCSVAPWGCVRTFQEHFLPQEWEGAEQSHSELQLLQTAQGKGSGGTGWVCRAGLSLEEPSELRGTQSHPETLGGSETVFNAG